jgi:hypothetical protein
MEITLISRDNRFFLQGGVNGKNKSYWQRWLEDGNRGEMNTIVSHERQTSRTPQHKGQKMRKIEGGGV